MIRELESPYGNVCPLLKLSEHYGVDYTAVLQTADYNIHNRLPVGTTMYAVRQLLNITGLYHDIAEDMVHITEWMRDQHTEAEALEEDGRLSFSKNLGKWIVV